MAIQDTTFDDLTPEQQEIGYAVYNKVTAPENALDFNDILINEGKVLMVSNDLSQGGYKPLLAISQGIEDNVKNSIDMEDRLPVGSIIPFVGAGLPSGGWFLCNGGELSKRSYPELFDVIGYTYGGDGDTFLLPDLTGRFLEGSNVAGEKKEAGLPNISGGLTIGSTGQSYWDVIGTYGALSKSNYGTFSQLAPNGYATRSAYRDATFDASQGGTDPVYGKSTTVQPASLTVRYIIKAVSGKSQIVDATLDQQVALNTEALATTNANLSALAESSEIVAHGGSDSTGYYIRYSNGVQICWKRASVSSTIVNPWGGLYLSDQISLGAYPIPFASLPTLTITNGAGGYSALVLCVGSASATSMGNVQLTRATKDATSSQTFYLNCVAIGRWK